MTASVAPPSSATVGVRVTDRAILNLVSVLIFLPSALFAPSLRAPPAALVLVGCLGALTLIFKAPGGPGQDGLDVAVDGRKAALCLALALLILLLGGETHVFFSAADWLIRDAVLADLVLADRPVAYVLNGVDYLQRAPLGMYVLPGALGKLVGLKGAHVALLAQNAVILGGAFYLLMRCGAGWMQIAVMVFFSGLAVVGVVLCSLMTGYPGVANALNLPLTAWALDAWNPYFQYSSSMVQFFWAPNHALPGWWLATLILLRMRGALDIATIGVTLAGAMFWSPLAVIPATLWLAVLTLGDWRAQLSSPRLWLGAMAGLCFAPIAVYMLTGASAIDHGYGHEKTGFFQVYILFVAVNLAFSVVVFANLHLLSRPLRNAFLFSIALLLLLPWLTFGPTNDLVSRGGVTALVISSFAFAEVLRRREIRATPWFAVGLTFIVVSAASPVFEIARAIVYPPYDISDCSVIEADLALGATVAPPNYTAPVAALPNWLIRPGAGEPRRVASRRCWSHRPDVTLK